MYKNLDIEFCRKVLEFAEAEHEDFTHNQQCFYDVNTGWDQEKQDWVVCGTSGCIAGIACMLDSSPRIEISKIGYLTVNGERANWDAVARKSMGLTPAQAQKLFMDTCSEDDAEGAARDLLRKYIHDAEVERFHQGNC